jgi:hypothetical protein
MDGGLHMAETAGHRSGEVGQMFMNNAAASTNTVTAVLVKGAVHVRFEVFTAVTMKNGVFWDVTACDSCKN